MFLVISRRPEFMQTWRSILGNHGAVVSAASPKDLPDAFSLRLAVIDFRAIENSPGEQLHDWQQRCGSAKIILGGTLFSPQREMAALAAGVVACCGQDETLADMERVVAVVLQGGVWISRTTLPHFVGRLQAFSVRTENPAETLDKTDDSGLTARQLDVARLVGEGANNKEIARRLGITDRTVKAHLTTIFEKLGVTDRLQLALYVTRHRM